MHSAKETTFANQLVNGMTCSTFCDELYQIIREHDINQLIR